MSRDWMSEWEDENEESSFARGQAFVYGNDNGSTATVPDAGQIKSAEKVPALARPQQSGRKQLSFFDEQPPQEPARKDTRVQLSIFDLPARYSHDSEQQ